MYHGLNVFHAFVCRFVCRQTIADVYYDYGYYLDPHGAVGWAGAQKLKALGGALLGVIAVAATAHPAKFSETVENITGAVPVPAAIKKAMGKTARSLTIPADLSALRDYLLGDS